MVVRPDARMVPVATPLSGILTLRVPRGASRSRRRSATLSIDRPIVGDALAPNGTRVLGSGTTGEWNPADSDLAADQSAVTLVGSSVSNFARIFDNEYSVTCEHLDTRKVGRHLALT